MNNNQGYRISLNDLKRLSNGGEIYNDIVAHLFLMKIDPEYADSWSDNVYYKAKEEFKQVADRYNEKDRASAVLARLNRILTDTPDAPSFFEDLLARHVTVTVNNKEVQKRLALMKAGFGLLETNKRHAKRLRKSFVSAGVDVDDDISRLATIMFVANDGRVTFRHVKSIIGSNISLNQSVIERLFKGRDETQIGNVKFQRTRNNKVKIYSVDSTRSDSQATVSQDALIKKMQEAFTEQVKTGISNIIDDMKASWVLHYKESNNSSVTSRHLRLIDAYSRYIFSGGNQVIKEEIIELMKDSKHNEGLKELIHEINMKIDREVDKCYRQVIYDETERKKGVFGDVFYLYASHSSDDPVSTHGVLTLQFLKGIKDRVSLLEIDDSGYAENYCPVFRKAEHCGAMYTQHVGKKAIDKTTRFIYEICADLFNYSDLNKEEEQEILDEIQVATEKTLKRIEEECNYDTARETIDKREDMEMTTVSLGQATDTSEVELSNLQEHTERTNYPDNPLSY